MATTGYSYDLANRLTSIDHQDNTPTTFAGYDYTYDAANRITSIDSFLDGLSEYTYDNAGQLTDADHTTQTDEGYTYDDNGNRLGGDYDTDANNLTIEDDDYTYAYDDEGNRVLRTDKTTGDYVEYTWDHRNRLTLVTFKNSSNTTTKQVAYEYDAFDRRVRKRVDTDGNSSWDRGEQYVYDGAHIALQFDDAGDLTRRNLFGPAIDQVLASEFIGSPNDTHWYFADHLGTVRDVYSYDDTLNDLVSEGHIEYDSFGNIVDGAATAEEAHFAYTGREWDADAELFYYRHRWYDAKLGQFVSQDPIGFAAGDANVRRYVNNSSLLLVDPFGLAETWGDFFYYDVGATMYNLPSAYVETAWNGQQAESLAAWADGVIPFADPLANQFNAYDPCDPLRQDAQWWGGVSRNALLAAGALHVAFLPTAATVLEHSALSGTVSVARQLLVWEVAVNTGIEAGVVGVVVMNEVAMTYPIATGFILTLIGAWLSTAGGAPPDPTNPWELGMVIYDWISGWSDEDYIPDIVPTPP